MNRRNKIIRTVLIIFLSMILFSTGAICTNCGEDVDDSEKIGVDADGQEKDNMMEEMEEEQQEDEEEEPEPSVELKVYEGPLYSEPDDICFYRVQAIIEGFTEPVKIQFSKDDSKGSWGKDKAQVNLKRGQEYTLTATVSDEDLTETASIELTWDCDEDTPEGELVKNSPPMINSIVIQSGDIRAGAKIDIAAVVIDPDNDEVSYYWSVNGGVITDPNRIITKWELPESPGVYELSIEVQDIQGNTANATREVSVTGVTDISKKEKTALVQQTGSISTDGIVDRSQIFIGNSSEGKSFEGYVSFDISDLYDKEITSARLILGNASIWEPKEALGDIMVSTLDFGNTDLNSSLNNIPSELIVKLPNSTGTIDISSEALVEKLKKRISQGSSRMQFKIYYQYPSAYSGTGPNGLSFNTANIRLSIGFLQ